MKVKDNWQKYVYKNLKEIGALLPCHYCDTAWVVDNLEVHLILAHEHSAKDAKEVVDDIVSSIPLDEDDNPLESCSLHGLHRIADGCDKCGEDDQNAYSWQRDK